MRSRLKVAPIHSRSVFVPSIPPPWAAPLAALLGSICVACAGSPEQSFASASVGVTQGSDTSSGSESGENGPGSAEATGAAEDTGDPQSCCEPHDEPGCDEPDLRACVCGLDAICCVSQWDANCVTMAMIDCGGCMPGGAEAHGDTTMAVVDGTDTTAATSSEGEESDGGDSEGDTAGTTTGAMGDEGACCSVTEGISGCADETIEQCVCAMDQFCCNNHWDYLCVQEAASMCAADCTDDCCDTHPEPGCLQHSVTMCVCDFDEYCCNVEWDQQCLNEAMQSCDLQC